MTTTPKECLEVLLRGFSAGRQDAWRDDLLNVDLGRSDDPPIKAFYLPARNACAGEATGVGSPGTPGVTGAPAASSPPTRPGGPPVLGLMERVVEALAPGILDGTIKRAAVKNAAAERMAALGAIDDPASKAWVAELNTAVDDPQLMEAARRAYDRVHTVKSVAAYARAALLEANPRQQGPEEGDWQALADHVTGSTLPRCSLIYDYWLDEVGLPWTLERLADRIENGLTRHTQPLMAVRAPITGPIANVVAAFILMWQRGDLAALDERRRQYAALYGFPLHAAGKWEALETLDPRNGFPLAFHRFLHEAMRFYRERRNRMMDADPQASAEAFGTLVDALREGNENLRLVRPPEVRAQIEYTKQALGGYAWPVGGAVNRLADAWKAVLPGRPGVREGLAPWQFAVETVGGLYGWKRAGIRDYVTLADHGEAILVLSRIVGEMSPTSGVWLAFLLLMQDSITRYVNAFKAVAAVDLEARPFALPPADALAKRYPPPAVPPLKRSWNADLPAGV